MTITTPEGVKVRCTSKRRFFVVIEYSAPGKPVTAQVDLRTDNLATARKKVTARTFFATDGRKSIVHIFDSARKEFVR